MDGFLIIQANARTWSSLRCRGEVWRQLWRVLERCAVAVLVLDVRHPLLHLPPALVCAAGSLWWMPRCLSTFLVRVRGGFSP